MKQSQIVSVISNDNNFAVFGFNKDIQQIQQSTVNITISYKTYISALICFQCDIKISSSILVFIASGQSLSGLMSVSGLLINLVDTTLQYRFSSQYSAGLVINTSKQLNFDINNMQILGYNVVPNALLIYYSNISLTINTTNVQVCSNSISNQIQLSSTLVFQCENICENEDVFVYGICANSLVNGQMQNYSLQCVDPFVFNGSQCVCKEQYLQNGTKCIEVIFQLNKLLNQSQQNFQLMIINTESIIKVQQDFDMLKNSVESNLAESQNAVIQIIQKHEQYITGNTSALNVSIRTLDQYIFNNTSVLDQRIQNNATFLYNALKSNISDLVQQINQSHTQLNTIILSVNSSVNNQITDINQSVYLLNQQLVSNISLTNNSINNNFNATEQHIFGNVSILDDRLNSNTSILDQRIFSNATAIYAALVANISLKDKQIQELSDQLVFLQGLIMNTKEYVLQFKNQQVLYTFKLFDITKITNSIASSNFSSGYAFSSQTIQNSFLDILSISSSFTLFQTQISFYNIKIQLEDIQFSSSSSLISQNTQLTINQMSIVSNQGTQISISPGSILSLLQRTAISSNITNMFSNIQMKSNSYGALNLINIVSGYLSITGYYIQGIYICKNTMALSFNQANNSIISLSYIYIVPQLFSAGNLSSYLASVVNNSTIHVNHVSISVGDTINVNILSLMSTSQTNYFVFGGLVTQLNNSILVMTDINSNQYEQINTQFTNFSGQFVGFSNFSMISVCQSNLFEYLYSQIDSQFNKFGLVGYSCGNLYIDTLSVIYTLYNSTNYNYAGIFGYINGTSSDFANLDLQITIILQQISQYVGALAGALLSSIQKCQNINIQYSNISSSHSAGLVASICSNIYINMIKIYESSINCSHNVYSSSTWAVVGGIIGQVLDYDQIQSNKLNIKIFQCKIQSISIYSYHIGSWALCGGLIGDSLISPISVKQTIISKSDIQAHGPVTYVASASGLISYMYRQNNIDISNIFVNNNNLIASSNKSQFTSCSGVFSQVIVKDHDSTITVSLSNSIISNMSLNVNGPIIISGIVLGNNKILLLTVNQVSTEGVNTINGVTITNCANVVGQSQSGC
ncbi:Growth_factor receptor cysteine-rich domain superfamily [Hexamita inflata]|uniref:Growth factor receptor cysteine-rich domain superfamily n=1 Tax=Hexamita inflata TaxID=28002 RepID=A0AA86Q4S4_9EUKA|nr:Growth factor receptor cysteine-rich domain superfamily [Hexamita inflata]